LFNADSVIEYCMAFLRLIWTNSIEYSFTEHSGASHCAGTMVSQCHRPPPRDCQSDCVSSINYLYWHIMHSTPDSYLAVLNY